MSRTIQTEPAPMAIGWRQREGTALVEAYSQTFDGWEIVAEGRDTPELNAREVAAKIVGAINGRANDERLIEELTRSLEICMSGEMDFSTEQEADAALHMAGERRLLAGRHFTPAEASREKPRPRKPSTRR